MSCIGPGEYRGMKKVPGERLGVGVKSQGNAGEFWGNVSAC